MTRAQPPATPNARTRARRAAHGPWLALGAAGLLAGALAALLLGLGHRRAVPPLAPAAVFEGLTAGDGRPVAALSLAGHYKVVAFGYTACPDACPTTLTKLHAILTAVGPGRDALLPLFVTLDPVRDTPDVLRAYTAHFDARIVGLTGAVDAVRRSAASLSALPPDPAAATTPEGAPNHAVGLYLLGPDNRLVRRYDLQDPTALVANDLRQRLMGG